MANEKVPSYEMVKQRFVDERHLTNAELNYIRLLCGDYVSSPTKYVGSGTANITGNYAIVMVGPRGTDTDKGFGGRNHKVLVSNLTSMDITINDKETSVTLKPSGNTYTVAKGGNATSTGGGSGNLFGGNGRSIKTDRIGGNGGNGGVIGGRGADALSGDSLDDQKGGDGGNGGNGGLIGGKGGKGGTGSGSWGSGAYGGNGGDGGNGGNGGLIGGSGGGPGRGGRGYTEYGDSGDGGNGGTGLIGGIGNFGRVHVGHGGDGYFYPGVALGVDYNNKKGPDGGIDESLISNYRGFLIPYYALPMYQTFNLNEPEPTGQVWVYNLDVELLDSTI